MAANAWQSERDGRRIRTTIVDRGATTASDLVDRERNPTEPDTVWCGDITDLRTGEGRLLPATVIELFSRRVAGWSVAAHMRTDPTAPTR